MFLEFKWAKVSIMLQGSVSVPILVPVSSSSNHVELHMRFQSKNARYALMTLANEMSDKCKITEPIVRKSFKGIIHSLQFCNIVLWHAISFESLITWFFVPVIVLYDVDKVNENNQRLIKWIIDSSSDACKIIMTCQDESNLLDSIKNRCKIISICVPSTHEVSFHFSNKPGPIC
jgi:replication factor C subunit 3/5